MLLSLLLLVDGEISWLLDPVKYVDDLVKDLVDQELCLVCYLPLYVTSGSNLDVLDTFKDSFVAHQIWQYFLVCFLKATENVFKVHENL